VPVLFRTGGAPGIHPSEVSSPDGSPQPFDWNEPAYRWLSGISAAHASDRPEEPRFPGSHPPGIALSPHGDLSRWPLAPPLGFDPLGQPAKALSRASPELLPCAWPSPLITRRGCPHFGVSVNLRLASPDRHRSAAQPRPPLWASCTCPLPTIRICTSVRAMEFTSRQVLHYCRPSGGLWTPAKPCRGWSGSALGAEHLPW
jgi:hypothetical protein